MDRQTDGQINKWADKQVGRQTYGQTAIWTDSHIEIQTGGQTDMDRQTCTDRLMDRQRDGPTKMWTKDRWTYKQAEKRTYAQTNRWVDN